MNFLSDLYGPYPFDSTGAVADRAAGVGRFPDGIVRAA